MVEEQEGLRIERRGGLMILTIMREARRNALDARTSLAVDQAVETAETDPEIKVLLLTATGPHAFCAGMDLKEAAKIGAGHGLIPDRGFAGITERRRRKPLIVAVNGAAVAGGFEIVLAADLVIAAEHATFGLSEIKRGMFAFAGGIQRLSRVVPRATALAMILTGAPISARRAWELGLISDVVSGDALMPAAYALAETLLDYDAATLMRAKALHDMAADAPIAESLRFGRAWGEDMLGSAATRNGIAVFAAGSAPPA